MSDASGAKTCDDPNEPFGASTCGTFLGLPGQWNDESMPDLSYNVDRWYDPNTGRYTRPDPLDRASGLDQSYYRYSLSDPLRYRDHFGLFEINPNCSDCVHPILASDNRPLSTIIVREVGAWCRTRLDEIQDVDLRGCIHQTHLLQSPAALPPSRRCKSLKSHETEPLALSNLVPN